MVHLASEIHPGEGRRNYTDNSWRLVRRPGIIGVINVGGMVRPGDKIEVTRVSVWRDIAWATPYSDK